MNILLNILISGFLSQILIAKMEKLTPGFPKSPFLHMF